MPARKAGSGDDGLRKSRGGKVMEGAGSDTSIPIVFEDGTEKRLDFKLGAIEAIENSYPDSTTGNPTTPIGMILRWQRGGFGMSWSQLKVFMWAGLLWEDRNLKKEDLDGKISLRKMQYYSTQVDDALKLAFGITDEEIKEAYKKAEAEAEARGIPLEDLVGKKGPAPEPLSGEVSNGKLKES